MAGGAAGRENVCDRLANELIRRVITGDYAVGERLPPERSLALELGTDRTSLRIALAQLKRLNLLSIVQGSGAVVKDYREHAGVEFFLHAFTLADTPAEPALISQMLQYFHLTMPGVFGLAAARASDDELAAIEEAYRRQTEVANDPVAAARLGTEAIDLAARASGNLLFQMIFRSTRPLRLRVVHRVFSLVDGVARAEANLQWAKLLRSRTLAPDEIEAHYRRLLSTSYLRATDVLAGPGWAGGRERCVDERRAFVVAPGRDAAPTITDRLAQELMRRIWLGTYGPGQRLLPERELALELGTDRTSLRVALGQLKRMNLISALQGSGMVVKDFRREAGIDFLEHVFALEDTPLEAEMLDQVADYLNATVPALVGLGARQATPESLERLERIYLEARASVEDVEAVSELLVQSQDFFAAETGNMVVALVYRSTRPLRKRLQRHVSRSTDMRRRLDAYLDFVRLVKKDLVATDEIEGLFRTYQRRIYADTRAALAASNR